MRKDSNTTPTDEEMHRLFKQVGPLMKQVQNLWPQVEQAQKMFTREGYALKSIQDFQRAEAQLTTLDTGTPVGRFNALHAVLCDINPDFHLSGETSIGDLYDAVLQVHPEWFENEPISEEEFWDVLQSKGHPKQQYFTTRDELRFYEAHPEREATGFRLRELLDWMEGPQTQRANEYPIHTSQEISTLAQSACNGKRGLNWRNDTRRRTRIYEVKNGSHRTELGLTTEEEEDGLTMAALETLTKAQDADFVFALLYICRVLAPPAPLPQNLASIAWFDLEDIAEGIGWNPSKRTRTERDELRARIYSYIVFGDRVKVIGQRTNEYTERATGEVIETRLESAIWRITDVERPLQAAMFGEVPRRVRLVISKEWESLLTSAKLAQYLPHGELLGSIAPKQVAGDWARLIGLVLAGLWRRNPREVQADTIRPTRRELLMCYTPKTQTVDELLNSKNPQRAVEYWHDALGKLLELGFIARQGEVTRTVDDMLKPFERKGWQQAWLDEQVIIVPGPKMQVPVEERALALPPLKPKDLTAKRCGRPRKKPKAQ